MVGIIMSFVCVLMLCVNIPGIMNGSTDNIFAGIICGSCAIHNLVLGIKSL